jgi:hypothetical protein
MGIELATIRLVAQCLNQLRHQQRAPMLQGTYSINHFYNPLQLLFVALQFSPNSMTNYTMHCFNHLLSTGHVTRRQFKIEQLYALPTLYLCVLYLSENKQRLVPLTA